MRQLASPLAHNKTFISQIRVDHTMLPFMKKCIITNSGSTTKKEAGFIINAVFTLFLC